MKPEFEEYFKSIGITSDEYCRRIEEIMSFFLEFTEEEIDDIFVDEYIKEDGTRIYEGITLYSNSYDMAGLDFLTEDHFHFFLRKKKMEGFKIKKKNYDFKKATDTSRLNIEMFYDSRNLISDFKASKENCNHLKQIFLKYFLPNWKEL